MAELPPIIKRLDAHLAEADTLGQCGHINASRDVLVNVARSDASELRALVLQLQEERDQLSEELRIEKQHVLVMTGWDKANQMEAERDKARETARQYALGVSSQITIRELLEEERDALLEALQVITELARDGWRDTESSPAYHFERIQDKALDAIANAEGKDE